MIFPTRPSNSGESVLYYIISNMQLLISYNLHFISLKKKMFWAAFSFKVSQFIQNSWPGITDFETVSQSKWSISN